MKTNRLITLFTAGLIALVSCDNKYESDFVPKALREFDYSTVEFSVLASDLTHEDVNVVVEHNGPADLQWYGFLSEGSSKDVQSLINSKIGSLTEADVHVGASQTVRFTSLKENSVYQYVAFALDKDKKICGKAGDLVFTTNRDKAKVTFSLEALNISKTSADIAVTMNNANENFTWYGVLTSDVNAEDNVIISAALKNLNVEKLFTGTTKTVSLTGLAFGTEYKYVAFGVDQDKAVYGTAGSVKFSTIAMEFVQNPNWTITFEGVNEDESCKITNTSSDNELGYRFIVLSESSLNGATDPVKIISVAAAKAEVELKSEIRDGITYEELLRYGTSSENFQLPFDKYYAAAIGFDNEGNITGDYALSEIFEFKDDRTPYERWLGKWEVKRGNETDIWIITENVKNSSYKIDGIDNIAAMMTDGTSFPIDAKFNSTTGDLIIHIQTGLATITIGDGTECSLGLYGVIEYAGKYYYVNGDYDIVALKHAGNNSATMEGNVLQLQGLEGDFPILGMRHVLTAEQGEIFVNDDFTPFDQTIKQISRDTKSSDDHRIVSKASSSYPVKIMRADSKVSGHVQAR